MRVSGHLARRTARVPPFRLQRRVMAAGGAALLATLVWIAGFREAPHEPVTLVARTAALTSARTPSPVRGLHAMDGAGASKLAPAGEPASASTPRDLVARALQSHDLQLRAQAYRLVRHCAFVLTPGNVAPLVAPPPWMKWESVRLAEQAWQALAGRCQSLRDVADRETVQRRLDPAPGFGGDGGDPLDGERRWLTSMFERHGAAALLWAGDTLVTYLEERTDAPDGDGFETLDPEAIQIARCRFGEDCGADSDAAHAACLTLGACEGDVPQRLLAALDSRAARERVLRQAGALADALERGDLGRYALGK